MTGSAFPSGVERVTIVEVGPRDGLQNESTAIATETKLAFIRALVSAGLKHVEATSFVHPKAVPQLADAAEVMAGLTDTSEVSYPVLVPNLKGLDRALDCGAKRIALFTAASETFTQKNINMSIAESLDVFKQVATRALQQQISVRAYLSTAFVCPYEGDVPRERVRTLVQALLDLGADEVSVSDTIGAAAPSDVFRTVGHVLETTSTDRLALHFHDTYGTALANVSAGLQLGITTYDSSAGGLGGCPFAPGALGNLATEDLIYLLDRIGIAHGVNLEAVVAAARLIEDVLGKQLPSRQARRLACARESGKQRKKS